jgi:hypothetical protein
VQQLQEPSLVVPTLLRQNSKGVTPLMLACRAGHAACVAALLDNGADPLLLDKATRRWECAAWSAVAQYSTQTHIVERHAAACCKRRASTYSSDPLQLVRLMKLPSCA